MNDAAPNLMDWIGRKESQADYASISSVAKMSATLDREDLLPNDGDPVPPGWHWIYFNPTPLARQIQHDGHAMLGDFWPPVGMPRRMFAGARMTFHKPLRLGEKITREAEITDVSDKEGRNGRLVFVGVKVEVSGADGLALIEEQDIVYRPHPSPNDVAPPPQPAPEGAQWTRTIEPDPVLLFRFSALTFNGHRIHYDHPYVTGEEAYPGLVVHGPLLSTLLIDLLRESIPEFDNGVETFGFRAMRPVFATGTFDIAAKRDGNNISAWALDNEGFLAMKAEGTMRA
jgi:3-methylfumaryl-CoA hydratase